MPLVRHACLHILNSSYNSGGLSSLAPLFWGSRPEKSENPCSSPLDLLFYYFKRPIILWNHLIGLHWILGPLPQSEYLDNMTDFNFQTDLTYVSFFQFVLCGPINQNKLLLSTRSMLQCQLVHAWKSLMPCYKIVFSKKLVPLLVANWTHQVTMSFNTFTTSYLWMPELLPVVLPIFETTTKSEFEHGINHNSCVAAHFVL